MTDDGLLGRLENDSVQRHDGIGNSQRFAATATVPQSQGPNALPRVNILGVGVAPVSLTEIVDILESWRMQAHRGYVCCVSVHGLVSAKRDARVRAALNGASLTTLDGMPLVWWARHAGFPGATRACGPDLLQAMCAIAAERGHRHYFYGGSPAVLNRLVSRLQTKHPGLIIAGAHAPPFRALTADEDAADIAAINDARPDFVWVGLGMPKQERWMAAHAGRINASATLGVGAAFDFHAGALARAPAWMQRSGLEWMFRLVKEPRRLARRYLIDNAVFVAAAMTQLAGWHQYPVDQ